MRVLARNGKSQSYLIGDGPFDDPMQKCSVVTLGGYLHPPIPFAQHLKFGDWQPVKNDPDLLEKLKRVPKYTEPDS